MTENEVMDNQTEALAKQMAAPIIAEHKRNKKFMSRNRGAWLRMNRPEKFEKMNRGGAKIMSLLDRYVYSEGRGI